MKKKIHLFFRKPSKNVHYSVENFYKEIFKDFKDENFEIKTKICPLSSRGIFNRIYLIFWAFFNQGDINHITGDINFISLFLQKKKTIRLDLYLYYIRMFKSRSLATKFILSNRLRVSGQVLKKPHKLIVMMGKSAQEEINKASKGLIYKYKLVNSITSSDSKILLADVKK